jgi:hypothetical protein
MDCEPCGDLAEEFALLDAQPVVDKVRIDTVKDRSRGIEKRRVICTMWCGSTHASGDLKQPSVMCNQTTVPNVEHALRALRRKIVAQHADCLAAAETTRAAAAGPCTRPPPDALSALMAAGKKQQAAARAEAAIKAVTERRDAARQQLADAELELAALTAAAGDSQLPAAKRQKQLELERWQVATGHWTQQQWSEYEAGEQARRSVEITGLAAQPLAPHRGVDGFLQHWRRGLVGAVQSWARGCKAHVVSILMTLIGADHGFGVEAEVRDELAGEQLSKAKTDAYIVDRAVAALATLKLCGTEQARQEYHIVLGALAPVPAAHANKASGMARPVADRLKVRRDRRARTKKQEDAGEQGRPFAFHQATIRRVAFDAAVQEAKEPLCVGDAVLAKGQLGTLKAIDGSACTIEFRAGEVSAQISYREMDGRARGKGNARVQRPVPSLAPGSRETRSDGITPAIIAPTTL